jgi:hypothetical protein
MNERSKSDLLFEEDEEFIDALEEAVERLSRITGEGEFTDDCERAAEALNRKKDDPPLLIF